MSGDHNQYQKSIKLQDENESPPEKWAQFGQVNGLRPEPTIDGWPLYSGLPSQTKGVDAVNRPPHYTDGGIETIDFIEAKQLGYNLGNAIKYISRAGKKGNRLQDLQKAQWYVAREIRNEEKNT